MINYSNINKAILLFMGLYFASISSIAQPYIKVNKKIGNQQIFITREHYDGGYIVIEYDRVYFYARKYSQNGLPLWQKKMKSTIGDYFQQLRMTRDSGFILVGTTYKYFISMDDNQDPMVIRYDKCGNILWKKVIISDTAYLAVEALELNNGNIAILTTYPGNSHNKYYSSVMLFSAAGKLITYRANRFEHFYLNRSIDSQYFYALGAAWFMSPIDSYFYRFPGITKYNSTDLSIIYSMPTRGFETNVGLAGGILSEKNPTNLKIMGSVAEDSLYSCLFDFDLKNEKIKMVKDYTPTGLALQLGDIITNEKHDIIYTTAMSDSTKPNNKIARLLDIRTWDTLNNLKNHVRPTGYNWQFASSTILKDGRVLTYGGVMDSANQYTDSYFLRFKPDLTWDSFRVDTTHYDFACGSPPTSEDILFTNADTIHIDNDSYDPANTNTSIAPEQEPPVITCWPNPAHDELYVGIIGEAKDYAATIYDMEGRLAGQPTAQSYNCFLFNTANLSNGVFVIQLVNKKNGIIGKYKFVKN